MRLLKLLIFIKENKEKIIPLILIISLGFALGYIFAQENNKAPIVIEKC